MVEDLDSDATQHEFGKYGATATANDNEVGFDLVRALANDFAGVSPLLVTLGFIRQITQSFNRRFEDFGFRGGFYIFANFINLDRRGRHTAWPGTNAEQLHV